MPFSLYCFFLFEIQIASFFFITTLLAPLLNLYDAKMCTLLTGIVLVILLLKINLISFILFI